ncbi:hypothetical protein Taro_012836 [Colocasia esculenta]|uniref:DUF1421 domain-containing protein n=1 Tax=Colocasia esculenta TaxID=4460 RepID=A0A843U9W3_COLES|nr:hypothetical protein [Colocasia esculenta]
MSPESAKMQGCLYLIRSNRFSLQYYCKCYFVLDSNSLNCFKSVPSIAEDPVKSAVIDSCFPLRELFRAKLGNNLPSDFSSGELTREIAQGEEEDIKVEVQLPNEKNDSEDSVKASRKSPGRQITKRSPRVPARNLSLVQTGMHVIRDKQAIAEAQMQLSKLQVSKGDNQPSDNSTTIPSDSQQPPMPLPQQPLQQPAQPSTALSPLQIPALPAPPVPNAPVPAPPQPNPTPIQFSTQIPQPHVSTISSMPPREPYLPPPSQASAEAPPQHYQPPPQQTHLPPPQPYPPAPQLTQYSQPPQPPPQPLAPSQFQHSLPHHTEESSPYMPSSQAYPPSIHQPPHLQSGPPPQQIYGPPSVVYEPPASRPAPVQPHFPTGYGPPSGSSFSDSYGGSPSPYRSAREHSPFPSSSAPSGGSTYPRLPTAQILPPAQPTGSSSGGSTGNRVPLDDVIDKVTTMGFPRDLVRATVRKLTENGQSVDLNVVLDKLMNGSGGQPPKGWYGR